MDDQDVVAALEHEATADIRVLVAPSARPHRVMAQIERSFRQAKPDKYGMLTPNNRIRLAIRSSPDCLSRALGIVNAICHACDARRWPVRIQDQTPLPFSQITLAPLIIQVLGQDLRIDVAEASRRQLCPPQPKSAGSRYSIQRANGFEAYDAASTYGDIFQYIPTGLLTVEIRDWVTGIGRRKWSDTPSKRIEGNLNGLFVSLIRAAGTLRAKASAEERERQERETKWRRHEERDHAEQFKKLLAEELLQETDKWSTKQRISAYVDAVRQAHIAAGAQISTDAAIGRWLDWADEYIQSLDCRMNMKRDPADPPPIVRRPVPFSWR